MTCKTQACACIWTANILNLSCNFKCKLICVCIEIRSNISVCLLLKHKSLIIFERNYSVVTLNIQMLQGTATDMRQGSTVAELVSYSAVHLICLIHCASYIHNKIGNFFMAHRVHMTCFQP